MHFGVGGIPGLLGDIMASNVPPYAPMITLPKPQAISEAYFVAMIYAPIKKKIFKKQKFMSIFLLLENSVPSGYGNQSTVLHEWTADGKHINLGYGCKPTLEAFYEAICNLL
jgi:hypothetical protein